MLGLAVRSRSVPQSVTWEGAKIYDSLRVWTYPLALWLALWVSLLAWVYVRHCHRTGVVTLTEQHRAYQKLHVALNQALFDYRVLSAPGHVQAKMLASKMHFPTAPLRVLHIRSSHR